MALVKCPECGKKISSKASSCPGCGCPQREPSIKKNKVGKTCDSCGGEIKDWSGELRCWTCGNLYDSAGNLLERANTQRVLIAAGVEKGSLAEIKIKVSVKS